MPKWQKGEKNASRKACIFILRIGYGFFRLDSLDHRADDGDDIENGAAFHSFKENVDARRELPECHQYKDGEDIDECDDESDEGKDEADGRIFSGGTSSRFVKKEEEQCRNGDIAEIVVGIRIVISGVDIRNNEEKERPDRRNEGEKLFHADGCAGCRCVHNEISRGEKEKYKTDDAKRLKEGVRIFSEKLTAVIKQDEKTDRGEHKTEQSARKDGKLALRRGKFGKILFSQKKV